jgi:hypothetical protein
MEDFKPCAKFELSGVILETSPEVNKEGEETGRLKVTMAIVGYNGKVDIIPLIAASPTAVNFINSNWNQGETVKVAGRVNISHRVERWEEAQGFGEPIIREKTVSCREFIITSGSEAGMDEDHSMILMILRQDFRIVSSVLKTVRIEHLREELKLLRPVEISMTGNSSHTSHILSRRGLNGN